MCIYIYIYIYAYMYIPTCREGEREIYNMRIYIYIYIYTNIHTHMHIHSRLSAQDIGRPHHWDSPPLHQQKGLPLGEALPGRRYNINRLKPKGSALANEQAPASLTTGSGPKNRQCLKVKKREDQDHHQKSREHRRKRDKHRKRRRLGCSR